MVIRLGVGASDSNLAGAGYRRILQGQTLTLHTISDTAVTVRAWARVLYDDGTGQLLTVPEVPRSGSRVAEALSSADVVIKDGWILNAETEMVTSGIKRGQTYVRLAVEPFGCMLLSDYCFSTFGQVSLGTFVPPGPGGSDGFLRTLTIKAEAVRLVETTSFLPVLSNMVRKIWGFSWYYTCSADVANRVIDVNILGYLGAGVGVQLSNTKEPWRQPSITLTANQDGMLFADEKRSGTNQSGTIAIDSQATAPSPFPILVLEDMASDLELDFRAVDYEDLDVDAIYALVEDWVML